MNLREQHRQFLVTGLDWEAGVARLPRPKDWEKFSLTAWEFMQANGAPYTAGEWFPGIDAAGSRRMLRAIRDLEAWGLVRCASRSGARLSHVRLTEAGRELAEEFATCPT